jgi:hypothetical protein
VSKSRPPAPVALAFKKSVGKFGIMGSYFDVFVQSLRSAYYRDLKSSQEDENHGNATLTRAEEDTFIGIARAIVRLGDDDLGESALIELASDIFPGKSFGSKWYYLFNILNRKKRFNFFLCRYRGFISRNKDFLQMGSTKETSKGRTDPSTINSVYTFIDKFPKHLKCIIFL